MPAEIWIFISLILLGFISIFYKKKDKKDKYITPDDKQKTYKKDKYITPDEKKKTYKKVEFTAHERIKKWFKNVKDYYANYDEREKENAGNEGEKQVSWMLDRLKRKYGGFIFNSFCFERSNGDSTEIDHIFICKGGIFIIETKNWNGTIVGNVQDEKIIYINKYNTQQREEINPIFQNETHIRKLSRFFHGNHPKMENMVIFLGLDIKNFRHESVFDLDSAYRKIEEMILKSRKDEKYIKKYTEFFQNIKNEKGISLEEHRKRVKEKYK